MEEEQAGLRCDRDADLIGQLEAATAFELFFTEKDLNVAQELGLVVRRKAAKDLEVPLDDRAPFGRERLGA
jgi:hypothetical protein